MSIEGNETPQNEEQFNQDEQVASEEVALGTEEQSPEGTPSEDVNTPPAEASEEPTYYTPEEMKTLQVDGIDTSRIPPEMRALYQAMQSPITRKSQELSQMKRDLEQGQNAPLQEPTQSQQQNQASQQPSVDEVVVNHTLQKLGLKEKPDVWEDGYENYVLELADTRRDYRETAQKRDSAFEEFNSFKSGFTPEQFKDIDSQAETKMYELLADPKTRVEGQRIQQAIQTGDTSTVLQFVRGVAKEHLKNVPSNNSVSSTPPATTTPSGGTHQTGQKDPSKMTMEEYRASREA